jgi:hydroxyacylglutathione hydrolase
MFLKTVRSEGIAHLSYIGGDRGQAFVIDPRRDTDAYLRVARREECRVTRIFETHRNEDYVIGSLDLARPTGAEIRHGEELPFAYGEPTGEGDAFDFGRLRLTVLKTPGHTDESLSFTLTDTSVTAEPFAVFTGDALFVGDVGRTDFFPDRPAEVAGLLHDSLFGKLLPLGDHVTTYPAHGAGSVCGTRMAPRDVSTIGFERRHNPALQHTDRDEFVRTKLAERHYKPPWFERADHWNLVGPPPLPQLPEPQAHSADEFARAMDEGLYVIDVRSPEAFAGAHVPGSLALPLPMLAAFAGWFLPYDRPIGLVVDAPEQIERVVRCLVRLGYDEVPAFLADGLHEWEASGREFAGLPQAYIEETKDQLARGDDFVLLDVRSREEYEERHLPGAVHLYVGELPSRLDELPRGRPITTFCGSGWRAIIAASILEQSGFTNVSNSLGSMAACLATGCPIVTG